MESAHWHNTLSLQQWSCKIMNERYKKKKKGKTLHGIHNRSSIDMFKNGKLSNGNDGVGGIKRRQRWKIFISKFCEMYENCKYTTISQSGWGWAHIVHMNTNPGRPSDLSISIFSFNLFFFFFFPLQDIFFDAFDVKKENYFCLPFQLFSPLEFQNINE